ncbi:MAG TPA: YDG domain-containing protein, partial [Verrucomicrobiae bacterium]|nr:YDG domain-containing protein [Verrucomicrobiae bacterium]
MRAATLAFSSVGSSGSNLVVSGSGGVPGATYYVLVSTNLALSPVTSWNRIATNVFAADGQFTNNIPITPSVPQGFIVIASTTPVTVTSGLSANNKPYDGTTTATLSSNNVVLAGVSPADAGNVWLSTNGYVANFTSAGVGTNLAVMVGGLSLAGSAAGNYSLSQPTNLTANITAVGVTISSGLTANNKAYDGTTTATLSSNDVVLAGVLAGDVGNVGLRTNGYTANFASAGVGTNLAVTVGGLSLTGGAAGNYNLSQPTNLTANISGRGVTISSGISANNKPYDGTTAATITSNNVVLAGVLPADAGNVRLSTNGYVANFSSANVGTNIAVTVSGLSLTGSAAGNYTLSQPAGLTANITAPAPVPGLVAAYPFNEGSGTTAFDVSSNGNNGTISGATWTTFGVYGDALVFNGANALVTIINSASLQLSSAMTLEAWVNPSIVSNAWSDLIYKGNDNYYLEGTSGNGSVPAMGGTFGTSDTVLYGIEPLPVNLWTHLATTYDGATTRLYVNGVQVASQAQTGALATSANPLQIGGDSIYGQYFKGAIDEVRVYNRALSAAEIQADMNTPLGNIPTAPGNLAAMVISSNQVNLSWAASTGNLGVSGYLVERSQGAGNTNFAQIGAVNSTNYTDAGLVPNTNYNYRVRATDASGD